MVRRTTTANHKEGYRHLKVSFLLLSVSWPIGILFRGRVGERESIRGLQREYRPLIHQQLTFTVHVRHALM